ncbi:esterase family protein [Sporolactobacillus sp. THM7-7]|nr:esterase family protein [Sporolactobacillus sp. THM7-7]
MRLQGNMKDTPLFSRLLNRTLPVIRYLPPGYDPQRKYPLLIAQDGRDYIQIGRLASTADEWIVKGIIRPMVIIAIPYENRASRWDLYHPAGPQHQAYTHMIADELLPRVLENLSIDTAPESRTLIGDSLGGTVSFLTALAFPHLFRGVIMQSPYVSNEMIKRIRTAPDSLPLSVYHSIGRKETEVTTTRGTTEDFLTPNLALHRALSARRLQRYTFHELDGSHTWRTWQPDVRLALLERFFVR